MHQVSNFLQVNGVLAGRSSQTRVPDKWPQFLGHTGVVVVIKTGLIHGYRTGIRLVGSGCRGRSKALRYYWLCLVHVLVGHRRGERFLGQLGRLLLSRVVVGSGSGSGSGIRLVSGLGRMVTWMALRLLGEHRGNYKQQLNH